MYVHTCTICQPGAMLYIHVPGSPSLLLEVEPETKYNCDSMMYSIPSGH